MGVIWRLWRRGWTEGSENAEKRSFSWNDRSFAMRKMCSHCPQIRFRTRTAAMKMKETHLVMRASFASQVFFLWLDRKVSLPPLRARHAGILAGLEQDHADEEQAGDEDDDGQNQLCSRHRSILPFKHFKNRSGRGNVIHSDIFMILTQPCEKRKGIFPASPVNLQLLPPIHLVFHRNIWYNKKSKCHIIPLIFKVGFSL